MTEVLKAGVLSDEIDLGALAHNAAEQAEEFVRKVCRGLTEAIKYYYVNIFFCNFLGLGGQLESLSLQKPTKMASGQ